MQFFVFLGRGYIREKLPRLPRLPNLIIGDPIWAINNQVWATFLYKIAQYISFRVYGLQGLGNLGNFFTYTPPVEHKLTEIGQLLPFLKAKKLPNRCPADQLSTTYRGHFFIRL